MQLHIVCVCVCVSVCTQDRTFAASSGISCITVRACSRSSLVICSCFLVLSCLFGSFLCIPRNLEAKLASVFLVVGGGKDTEPSATASDRLGQDQLDSNNSSGSFAELMVRSLDKI